MARNIINKRNEPNRRSPGRSRVAGKPVRSALARPFSSHGVGRGTRQSLAASYLVHGYGLHLRPSTCCGTVRVYPSVLCSYVKGPSNRSGVLLSRQRCATNVGTAHVAPPKSKYVAHGCPATPIRSGEIFSQPGHVDLRRCIVLLYVSVTREYCAMRALVQTTVSHISFI